jgi:Bacterial extracellular solute-binding proteins, family 3
MMLNYFSRFTYTNVSLSTRLLSGVFSAILTVSALGQTEKAENEIQELQIRIPAPGTLEHETTSLYYEKLLRLALEKTATSTAENIKFIHFSTKSGRERLRVLLTQDALDIIWSSTNKAREKQLKAIKFDLLRGLNAHRVLLIRKDDQVLYEKIMTLDDLRQFRIGTGTHWSDTDIYKLNRLPLVTSWNYEAMFRMLAAKRFDYMARGLQEVSFESDRYKHLNLVIEKNLILYYKQPMYFFVKKDNKVLADRLLSGLRMSEADGSLDKLFFGTPHLNAAWNLLQDSERRKIVLKTIELPVSLSLSNTSSSGDESSSGHIQ